MSPRPFRFGVLVEGVRSRKALLDTVRHAEDEGFSTLLIRDHFIAEPFGHQLAPLTTLATVASMTKRLRIGSLVFGAAYRHPVLLAKEIATLDVLSEGRIEVGLGTGFSRTEYEQAGLPFEPPRVRLRRLEEVLRVLRGLFADGPFTFAGKHYAITDLDSFPKPGSAAAPADSHRGLRPSITLPGCPRSRHHRRSGRGDQGGRSLARIGGPPG